MEVSYQGRMVDVEQVDFFERKEGWNEYQLTDGKVLRIKLICTRVFRATTEKDPQGNALYILLTQNVVAPVE